MAEGGVLKSLARRIGALLESPSFVWVAISLAVAIHVRSVDIFFHQDDFNFLEGLSTAQSIGRWLLTRHVDHYEIVPKLLYIAFLRLFGPTAVPWHLLMLAVHAANVFLVYRVLLWLPVSPLARNAAIISFAVSTVFHECLYWVAATNISLCLLFILLALVVGLRFARTGEGRLLPLLALCALLGGLCASTAVGAAPLVTVAVWVVAPKREAAGRSVAVAVAAMLGAGLSVSLGTFDASPATRGFVDSAMAQFDPVGGGWFALRSVFERLGGRFFTGIQLPLLLAVAITLGCFVLALSRNDRGQRPYAALAAAWVFGFTWLTLSFRTWLGEVVFVSRYQLIPAAGFCLVLALALENAMAWLHERLQRWLVPAIGLLMAAVTSVQAVAAVVAHQRWQQRTVPLGRAHAEIRRGLQEAIRQAREQGTGPLRMPDLAVGGGEGYRPSLRGMLRYLLSPAEQAMVRVEGVGRGAIDPRLDRLVTDVAAGRHNWLIWFDDLSVSAASCDQASIPAARVFPFQERGRFERGRREGTLRVEPFGQGQRPLLRSATPPLTGGGPVLTGLFRSNIPGELLLVRVGTPSAELGLGARLRLPRDEEVCLAIDLRLSARGAAADGAPLELRVVNELATYEIGPFCD